MVIGSVRPMIGRGPIDLWARSKRFVATSSGLIGRSTASGRIVASGPCGWGVSLLCSSRVACKKERGRSSCTNALPSNDASPLDVPAAQNPNGLASSIYGSSRGCIWRRVEGADFASASHFVALVLPMLPPISHLRRVPHPIQRTSAIHRHRRHERHGRYSSLYLWAFPLDERLLVCSGPSRHRHGERHRRNALP
jgi:hypothetical protein